MALNDRQVMAYQHLVHIIRQNVTINGSGIPASFTYSIIAQNVPCLFVGTDNIDTPTVGAGALKGATLLTMDTIHMESSTNVKDHDILKDVSVLPDGTSSQNAGVYARVLGAPRIFPNAGSRSANKLSLRTMTLEKTVGLPI